MGNIGKRLCMARPDLTCTVAIPAASEADQAFAEHLARSRDHSLLQRLTPEPGVGSYPNQTARPVRSGHYVLVPPVPLENPRLVLYSASMASELGFTGEMCTSGIFLRYFSGDIGALGQQDGWCTPYNKSWAGLFIGYHVCPFRTGCGYGDGRAISIAELSDDSSRWELQLKGAGTTPFCRRFDGRAVLRSSVREFLASEAMHALGVPSTRALSLVVSQSQQVARSHPITHRHIVEPVAITCRAAPSFLRIGSFELYGRRLLDAAGEYPEARQQLEQLVRYALDREFEGSTEEDTIEAMAIKLAILCAERVAMGTVEWLRVGYCHGNFQSDNCLISGRTMDFGPFSWVEAYDSGYCAWTGDDDGSFAFMNQPKAGKNNLHSLCQALAPLLSDPVAVWEKVSRHYSEQASSAQESMFSRKLGLEGGHEGAASVVEELLAVMEATGADWTITFRQLSALLESKATGEARLQELRLPDSAHRHHAQWDQWVGRWLALLDSSGTDRVEAARRIRECSPKYVPREWMLTEAYTAAEKGDYGPVQALHTLLQLPYDEQPEHEARYYHSERVQPQG